MSWISARRTRREGLLRAAGAVAAVGLTLGHERSNAVAPAQREREQSDRPGVAERDAEAARRRRRPRGPAPQLCQRIIVPAYFGPGAYWDRAVAAAPATDVMILNPNSGSGGNRQAAEAAAAAAARAAGIRVLGYVRTNLTRRSPASVKAEIDNYFSWYGVDGIYIDVATGKPADRDYYRGLAQHVRARSAGAAVALNPALDLDRGYLDFVDILGIYEWKYDDYRTKRLPEWIHEYPAERFIHVVYGVPNAQAARATLSLSKRRNAGHVFITQVANPAVIYKSLGRYWNLQVGRVCP